MQRGSEGDEADEGGEGEEGLNRYNYELSGFCLRKHFAPLNSRFTEI